MERRNIWIAVGGIGAVLIVLAIVWNVALIGMFEKVPSDLDRTVDIAGTYTVVDTAFTDQFLANETISTLRASGALGELQTNPTIGSLLTNPAVPALMSQPGLIGMLTDPSTTALLANPAVGALLGSPDVLTALADPTP